MKLRIYLISVLKINRCLFSCIRK